MIHHMDEGKNNRRANDLWTLLELYITFFVLIDHCMNTTGYGISYIGGMDGYNKSKSMQIMCTIGTYESNYEIKG